MSAVRRAFSTNTPHHAAHRLPLEIQARKLPIPGQMQRRNALLGNYGQVLAIFAPNFKFLLLTKIIDFWVRKFLVQGYNSR